MKTLQPITGRQVRFAQEFVRLGGNATQAAIAAGYGAAGAHVVGHKLLREDRVLSLVVAEIGRKVPGAQETARRLLTNRTDAIRLRAAMLLASDEAPAHVVGTDARPSVVTDADNAALRDHVIRFGRDLGVPPSQAGAELAAWLAVVGAPAGPSAAARVLLALDVPAASPNVSTSANSECFGAKSGCQIDPAADNALT